jgi:acyl-CoA reductase-like NAD-dependent aldehyde dehydrogenase
MSEIQTTIIPHSQQPLISRTYPSESELDLAIKNASEAQKEWSKVPLDDRIAIGRQFMVRSTALYHYYALQLIPQRPLRMNSRRCPMRSH